MDVPDLSQIGPWPGALLIKFLFDRDAARVTKALQAHRPGGVRVIRDQQYRDADPAALLDVYLPTTVDQVPDTRLSTVIWVHGGGWLSGSKNNVTPYFELIAAQGFTVIAVDYPLAPAAVYPTALGQLTEALTSVVQHAADYHVDPDRIFLAGDSAGAQLVSQIATLTTVPDYAVDVGFEPPLQPHQLAGVVLHCGYFDMRAFIDGGQQAFFAIRFGVETIVHAYTGGRAVDSPALRQMSTIDHVTADFPPTFICGGNTDPLTDAHSRPFAARLTELGVDVTTRFVMPDHQPALGHEFQFNLDNADGKDVLARTLAFLADHSAPDPEERVGLPVPDTL